MTNRILGIFMLLFAAGFGTLYYHSLQQQKEAPPAVQPLTFSSMIFEDLLMMQKKGLLPAEWSSIKTVAYNFNSSSVAQSLLRAEPIPIPTKPNGTTRLEVDFLSMDEETAASTIAVQFSLFDLASDNKLWEGAKTYNIGQFLKSEQQKEKTRPEN